MRKEKREELEYKSLFTDERYAKTAWSKIIGSSLEAAGRPLPEFYDKNGNTSPQSQIDMMAYTNVKQRLEKEGKSREPMQAELMIECAVLRSRLDTTTLNILLERTAGKVKDELNVSKNKYEDMTDEELALLAEYRERKALEAPDDNSSRTEE